MCGLVGYIPKSGKKVDLPFFMMTCAINDTRGGDSFGITAGYDIQIKGFGANDSKFSEFFITKNKDIQVLLDTDLTGMPLIGHARKSSSHKGYSNDSTHPHTFIVSDNPENYFEFSMAHNGTLKNDTALLKKYNLDTLYKSTSTWTDSKILAAILSLGHTEVLKEYHGTAAVIYYDKDNFYVWKGAENNLEERPLFFVEAEEGLYLSSIKEPLNLKGEPKSVTGNTLSIINLKGKVKTKQIVYERKNVTPIVTTTNFTTGYNTPVVTHATKKGINLKETKVDIDGKIVPKDKGTVVLPFTAYSIIKINTAGDMIEKTLNENVTPSEGMYYQSGYLFRSFQGLDSLYTVFNKIISSDETLLGTNSLHKTPLSSISCSLFKDDEDKKLVFALDSLLKKVTHNIVEDGWIAGCSGSDILWVLNDKNELLTKFDADSSILCLNRTVNKAAEAVVKNNQISFVEL